MYSGREFESSPRFSTLNSHYPHNSGPNDLLFLLVPHLQAHNVVPVPEGLFTGASAEGGAAAGGLAVADAGLGPPLRRQMQPVLIKSNQIFGPNSEQAGARNVNI